MRRSRYFLKAEEVLSGLPPKAPRPLEKSSKTSSSWTLKDELDFIRRLNRRQLHGYIYSLVWRSRSFRDGSLTMKEFTKMLQVASSQIEKLRKEGA